jgi:SAM-dependent methyltransferase
VSQFSPWGDPTHDELLAIYKVKYYQEGEPGWSPRMRLSFGYFTPDDYYEALAARLVTAGCEWADIGCGRDIFPRNPGLAKELVSRAGYVFGIDPDPNIKENPFINEAFHGIVEDCTTPRRFDVITMRMVAEHIVDPDRAIAKIAELMKPGGKLLIYTPYKWAAMSVVASLIPFRWHHPLKQLIWDAEARDTFPTAYKLNTRADLDRYASAHGLTERYFSRLDDCRVFTRYRWINYGELSIQRVLKGLGVHYPETCIIGGFERTLP